MEKLDKITVIKPKKGWEVIDLNELLAYKDLLYFLVVRGIKVLYAQSVLGVGWAIIQPLVQTLIFTLIFGNLAQLSSDGVPYILFSIVAMVPWTYFSNILSDSANSLLQNKQLLSKVYFPRIILPLSSVFSKLIDFSIGLIVLTGFLIYYQVAPTINLLYFPLLLLILVMSSLGSGMILSALAVQYRDVQYAMSFLVRILMYGAPVVYSIETIPSRYHLVYALNPMVGVIEGMRSAFLNTKPMPLDLLLVAGSMSLVLFVSGAFYFKRMERRFADLT